MCSSVRSGREGVVMCTSNLTVGVVQYVGGVYVIVRDVMSAGVVGDISSL